ncbi:uncharacterized protein LOC131029395 [Cryptomeria japonica]|uniref:uncharacterized protein LOC131029395 n=1 Tax=Cryptomeria japonica TaxID=3369 RepID=UPI0025AD6B8F|nr:uncharacterized protein LOC131029395 [Cryptomeria japonica]
MRLNFKEPQSSPRRALEIEGTSLATKGDDGVSKFDVGERAPSLAPLVGGPDATVRASFGAGVPGPSTGVSSFARLAIAALPPNEKPCPLSSANTSPVVVCRQDVIDNIGFYQLCGLVCRFIGLWPSLPDLHRWVSNSYKPLVAGCIELFPYAKGFFIASFASLDDHALALGKLWAWGFNSLLVKLWTPFNPLTESLYVCPVWVHLPNLPLRFWEHSCYEAIGNTIGRFLKINDAKPSMGHSTFARILIDIDISLPLLGDVVLMVGDRPWTQLLDYEGLPFRC